MKFLVMNELQIIPFAQMIRVPQNVAMPLIPRRVVDFSDDCLDVYVALIKYVKHIEWAHVVAEVSQLRQQPDRTLERAAGALANQAAGFVDNGLRSVKQMVATQERRRPIPTCGNHPVLSHEIWQFVEIQVDHEEPMLEFMRHRLTAIMRDVSFVDAALHASSSIPKCLATANALLTPSS